MWEADTYGRADVMEGPTDVYGRPTHMVADVMDPMLWMADVMDSRCIWKADLLEPTLWIQWTHGRQHVYQVADDADDWRIVEVGGEIVIFICSMIIK